MIGMILEHQSGGGLNLVQLLFENISIYFTYKRAKWNYFITFLITTSITEARSSYTSSKTNFID